MAEFLNDYIDNIEPSMNFESKATYINSFDDLTSLIITIGGALSIIIGIIGITVEKVIKLLERKLTGWQEKREI